MLYHLYNSQFGFIQICIDKSFIVNMTMKEEDFKHLHIIQNSEKNCLIEEKRILTNTIKQLDEFFNHEREAFQLPIKLNASPFSNKVYKAVLETEYGHTYSYKDIAQKAGSKRAYRAVGTAMKNNPYAMIIPCHRVIKANGEYGKYFKNDELKEKLIKFEQKD